tara:strand:+ start:91 stop:1503 length:1413 start_codon:yes stop_codon:yes gene_type:complete
VLWTADQVGRITGGEVTKNFNISGVSIDTRILKPNELFVALTDKRDGHNFILDAIEMGASGALVSRVPRNLPTDFPLIIVEDVSRALTSLGEAGRLRINGKVIAITGSVGKTSTKEMLKTILSNQLKIHASESSYNNHLGVPLTLANMPLDTQVAVVEIGMNHPGEILPLAEKARPDVAVITNIATAHLAAFESIIQIAEEKATILNSLKEEGIGIISGDYESLNKVVEITNSKLITFGQSENVDWRLSDIRNISSGTICHVMAKKHNFYFRLNVIGDHYAINALAALCAVEAVGGDITKAIIALKDWKPFKGRGERSYINLGDDMVIQLIDESYNASPASMISSLNALVTTRLPENIKGRRIAILGDMKELGSSEVCLHKVIKNDPSIRDISVIHCVGKLMKTLFDHLPNNKRGLHTSSADELIKHIKVLLKPGDIVMVKGSLSMKMKLVVDAIKGLGQPIQKLNEGDF